MFHYLPQLRQLTMRLQKPQPAVRPDEIRCIYMQFFVSV